MGPGRVYCTKKFLSIKQFLNVHGFIREWIIVCNTRSVAM